MATIVCPYNGVNVLRVCAQLRVEGSTYLLRAVFPTLIPIFTCCIHEQMFREISWCTLFKFSLLAYLSVYPLIYILQYIVYTLHTVYIQPPVYTRTNLLCQPMRKICKKSQYALTRWSWVQFTSVCTMQWGSCRQAVLAISRQSVRQACMTVCTAKTVQHAPPPPCRKCITNSIRNCHLKIKR